MKAIPSLRDRSPCSRAMYYAFAGALYIALSAKAAGLTEQHLRKRELGVQSQIYTYTMYTISRHLY